MKYLNLYEAKGKKDWASMSQEIVNDFKRIIKESHINTDRYDDLSRGLLDITIDSNGIRKNEYFLIEYTNSRRMSSNTIKADDIYYLDIDDYTTGHNYAHLSKFYNNLSIIGSRLTFQYRIAIFFNSKYFSENKDKKREIKEEIEEIKIRCESEGIEFQYKDDWDIELLFSQEIDKKIVLKERPYYKYLPKNIIDKFDDFMSRKNIMSDGEREEFAKIMNSGDWNKLDSK